MGVDTVGALNEVITAGNTSHLILLQEGLQEKLLSDIADNIVQEDKKIVLIAGPSSSGKTTFSHRLSIQLEIAGKRPHPISLDDYFFDREKSPKDAFGSFAARRNDFYAKLQFLNGKTGVPGTQAVAGRT